MPRDSRHAVGVRPSARRPYRLQSGHGGGHGGPASRLRLAARPHRVRRVPPKLRPQDAHGAGRRVYGSEPFRRGDRLHQPRRKRTRPVRARAHRHFDLLGLRPGENPRHGGAGQRHRQCGRRNRGRFAQFGRGVRGAEQRGRARRQPHHRVQRQRDVDRRRFRRHVRPARPSARIRRHRPAEPVQRVRPGLSVCGGRQRCFRASRGFRGSAQYRSSGGGPYPHAEGRGIRRRRSRGRHILGLGRERP